MSRRVCICMRIVIIIQFVMLTLQGINLSCHSQVRHLSQHLSPQGNLIQIYINRKYDKARDKNNKLVVMLGLTRRRLAEAKIFTKGRYPKRV